MSHLDHYNLQMVSKGLDGVCDRAARNTGRVQNSGMAFSIWGHPLLMPALPSVLGVASLPGFFLRLTSSYTDAHRQAGMSHQRQSHLPSHSASTWVASERRVHPGHLMVSSLLLSAAIKNRNGGYANWDQLGQQSAQGLHLRTHWLPRLAKAGKEA